MSGSDSPVHAYGDLDHEAREPERAEHALLPGGQRSDVRARRAIVSHDILRREESRANRSSMFSIRGRFMLETTQ